MNDFALQTIEPGIPSQIWHAIHDDPKLADGLTVSKLKALPEFREVEKNVLSAAVSILSKRLVIVPVATLGRENVYAPGPGWKAPQKFGRRVVGKKINRKPGYKQGVPTRPAFALQPTLDLGPNYARDETRERQLKIARALPLSVLEQVLAEKRAAAAREAP